MQIIVGSKGSQVSMDTTTNIDDGGDSNSTEKYSVTMTKKYYLNDEIDLNNQKNKKLIEKLDKFLQNENSHVEYEIHKGFGDIMIKIVDNDTKKVIKEMPPKKILDMIEKLCELSGVMLDKKA